jgi:hypothetical protein
MSGQTKPSIVFAHGLWADGSCYGDLSEAEQKLVWAAPAAPGPRPAAGRGWSLGPVCRPALPGERRAGRYRGRRGGAQGSGRERHARPRTGSVARATGVRAGRPGTPPRTGDRRAGTRGAGRHPAQQRRARPGRHSAAAGHRPRRGGTHRGQCLPRRLGDGRRPGARAAHRRGADAARGARDPPGAAHGTAGTVDAAETAAQARCGRRRRSRTGRTQ